MMCWGVVQLFDDETEKFMSGTDKKISIYKAKGIDDALLWELASTKEFKRLKPMNGGMIIDLVACEGYSNLVASTDQIQRPQSARPVSRRNLKDDDDSSGSGKHMSMDKDMIEKLKDGKGSDKNKKLQKTDSAKNMFDAKDKDKEKDNDDIVRMQRTKSTSKIKSPREVAKEKEKTEATRQTVEPIQKSREAPANLPSPPPPKHFPPPPPTSNPAHLPGTQIAGPAAPVKLPFPGDVKGGIKLPMVKLPPGKMPMKGPPPKEGVKGPAKLGGPLPPPK